MASILYVLFISRVKRKVCIKNAEDKSIKIFDILHKNKKQNSGQIFLVVDGILLPTGTAMF